MFSSISAGFRETFKYIFKVRNDNLLSEVCCFFVRPKQELASYYWFEVVERLDLKILINQGKCINPKNSKLSSQYHSIFKANDS